MFKIKREIEFCISDPVITYIDINKEYNHYYQHINMLFYRIIPYHNNPKIADLLIKMYKKGRKYLSIYKIDNDYIINYLLQNDITKFYDHDPYINTRKIGKCLSSNTNDIAINYLINHTNYIVRENFLKNTNDNAVKYVINNKHLLKEFNDKQNFSENINNIAVNFLVENPNYIDTVAFLHNKNEIAINYWFNNLKIVYSSIKTIYGEEIFKLEAFEDYSEPYALLNIFLSHKTDRVKNYKFLIENPEFFTQENYNNHTFYLQFTKYNNDKLPIWPNWSKEIKDNYTYENFYSMVKEAKIVNSQKLNDYQTLYKYFVKLISDYRNHNHNMNSEFKYLNFYSDKILKLIMDYKIEYKQSIQILNSVKN